MNEVKTIRYAKFFQRGMRKLLLILLIFSDILVQGQTKKVLFIGNSYTFTNNLPEIAATVASSMGDRIIYSSSAIGGYSLKEHSTNPTTINLIRQGGWDYVVLQEFSQNPSEPLAWVKVNVFPYAQYLDNEINKYNSNAETIFYMTWGRKNGDTDRCSRLPEVCTYIGMDNLTRERYMLMAQANHAIVSPVGAVWRYIRENYPSIELYDTDGSHPSVAGSYAAACCFYTAIFRKDPSLITYNYTLTPSDASRIRAATKQVVFNNLITWHIGEYDKYTITASSGTGGTINPTGNVTVSGGSDISFSISPNSGYQIADVNADNISVGTVASYIFKNVVRNHTLSAIFRRITHTINASAGTGGNINPEGKITVNHGTDRTFNITSDEGYQISDVKVDNVSIGSVSTYSFNNITSDHSISASFDLITFNIEANTGQGGTINPSGSLKVNYGSKQTYTIKADEGYQISDVKVDNVSIGSVSTYSFNNITSDHSISASFNPITLNIEANAGPGGVINPNGITTVYYGKDMSYTINPDKGYRIADVKVDNNSVGIVSTYIFKNVIVGHTITVEFLPITFSITGISGEGGSLSPSGTITVNYGTNQHYTITPDYGYKISEIILDGYSVGVPPVSFYINNITADHTFSVTFSLIKTYSITANTGKGGSISPSGTIKIFEKTDQTYIISPEPDFRIANVFADTISLGPVPEYTFKWVTDDHRISAIFSSDIEVELYPNPFKQELKINIKDPHDNNYVLYITDFNNKVLFTESGRASNTLTFFKPDIYPGLYLVSLYLKEKRVASIRLVKY